MLTDEYNWTTQSLALRPHMVMSRSSGMKRAKTPTFLIELPLKLDWSNEKPLRAHLEAARCLYNALLGEVNRRMRAMRTDPAQAGLHVPFLAPKRSSEHRRSHACASSTTFLSTSCTSMPSSPVSLGSLTTLIVRWLRRLLLAPIKRPIAWR